MFTRTLARSGIEISAMGLGCWAIGGPFWRGDQPVGWGTVDDDESVRAIHRGLDLGITFLDTADVYGCGHSERVLGRALAGRRDRVVIATKFGNVFHQPTRRIIGRDGSPEYVRRACGASLRRLNTDYIDLYQFHLGDYDPVQAVAVRDVLEELVAEGKIRAYGWSTDDPDRVRVFAAGSHCVSVQHRLNLFEGASAILDLCEQFDLASINRGPLGRGLLTGKFGPSSRMPQDDLRHDWNFEDGEVAERLRSLKSLQDLLTRDGRTLAQAALGWLWARSEKTVPIPGFKTVRQIEENVAAMEFGPLDGELMKEIDAQLGR